MLDFKFDWNKNMEIGIEIIDLQHRELFRIVRGIEQMVLVGENQMSSNQILEQLCEIRDYITYHFYTEEKILSETNPVELEEHKKQHEWFKEQINRIDCIALVADPVVEFGKIKDLIQEWLFSHILVEDLKILK